MRITSLPPAVEPDVGLRLVNVGVGATYVYVRGGAVVPPGVTTSTGTPPAAPPGMLCTVICVSLSLVKHDPDPHTGSAVPFQSTAVDPVNPPPLAVITTSLPPAVEPDDGVRLSNVGWLTTLRTRFEEARGPAAGAVDCEIDASTVAAGTACAPTNAEALLRTDAAVPLAGTIATTRPLLLAPPTLAP